LRKDIGLEVTDKINLRVTKHDQITDTILGNNDYICSETLAVKLDYVDHIDNDSKVETDLTDDIKTHILIEKVSN
jgi:isoleucyl-tRNA synthetase